MDDPSRHGTDDPPRQGTDDPHRQGTDESPRTGLVLVAVIGTVLAGTIAGGGLLAGAALATSNAGDAASPSTATDVPASPDVTGSQTNCSFPRTVTDTTGTELTIEERPERIVALQPSDAQIVWEINASSRVVGMAQGNTTAYLADTAGITDVKHDDGSVDVETVTNLDADLVLAANVTRTATIDQLRSTGTTVYHFGEVRSLAEIYRNVERTGALVGNCEAAADRVTAMRDRLDRIERALADEERPRVLYEFYGYTTGSNTHVHDLLVAAGAENVAATGENRGYFEINQEVVAATDPQWIVHPSDAPAPSGPPYDDTTALRERQVLRVDANYVNQAGPRVVTAIESMAQAFHPGAFDENGDPIVAGEDTSGTQTPGEETTEPGTMTTSAPSANATDAELTGPTDTTAGSGPGFTSVSLLVGVVGVLAALGWRRKGV